MTYAELFAAVSALTSGSFSIQVNTWQHRHGIGPDRIETEWTIYMTHTGHCEGKSPEAALAAFKLALAPETAKPEPTLDEISAAVGDASVSACSGCKETGIAPSHNGSRLCESGSIASGGTRAHCTCDVCF